jgi:hypothetical protein
MGISIFSCGCIFSCISSFLSTFIRVGFVSSFSFWFLS